MQVSLPTSLDRFSLPSFFELLDATRDAPEVTTDYSTLRNFCNPTGILVAGSKLRDWVAHRAGNNLKSFAEGINENNRVHSYLKHLGFFDYVGLNDEGNRIGEALGGAKYVPITRIGRPQVDFENASEEDWNRLIDEWFDALEDQARRVAGVLAGSFDDSQALRTYSYAIREIIRNVFEHSQADECFLLGQRLANGRVEISIVDEGVGIARTLGETHGVQSDADALRLAIRPGISRTTGRSDRRNIYDNSGFGLYILSELGASFGWFTLGSGHAFLYGAGRSRSIGIGSFKGTFFGLRLNATPYDIRSVLDDIIEAGEREADEAGIRVRASGRTRLIRS